MAKHVPLPPPGFDELSVDEKIEYLHALWDRIAARPDEVPLSDWQRGLVAERLAEHRSDPDAARTLDEVLEAIDERLRSRRE
jgi:putative addiction module component (TIGR02574 family)